MILKAKGDYGQMPLSKSKKYGISPVDEKDEKGTPIKDKKVWPPGSKFFRIVKGEKYHVSKQHPFFESKGGHEVPGSEKVQNDPARSANKGQRASN